MLGQKERRSAPSAGEPIGRAVVDVLQQHVASLSVELVSERSCLRHTRRAALLVNQQAAVAHWERLPDGSLF